MPACRMSALRGVNSEKVKAVKLEINAFHYIEGAKTRFQEPIDGQNCCKLSALHQSHLI